MLAILSRGRGSFAETTEACFQLCPPGRSWVGGSEPVCTVDSCFLAFSRCLSGYRKSGECSDASGGAAKLRCERCDANTFTDIANSSPKCERCQSCARKYLKGWRGTGWHLAGPKPSRRAVGCVTLILWQEVTLAVSLDKWRE